MRKFHTNIPIDHSVKDPAGLCELISPITGRPCHAKLPFRSIYHHLLQLHKVERPSTDHILWGFDLTDIPQAVFVTKARAIELQRTKSVPDTTQIGNDQISNPQNNIKKVPPPKKVQEKLKSVADFNIPKSPLSSHAEPSSTVENSPFSSQAENSLKSSKVQNSPISSNVQDAPTAPSSKMKKSTPVQSKSPEQKPPLSNQVLNFPSSTSPKVDNSKIIQSKPREENCPFSSPMKADVMESTPVQNENDPNRKTARRKLLGASATSLSSTFNFEYLDEDLSNQSFSILENIENYDLDAVIGKEPDSNQEEVIKSADDNMIVDTNEDAKSSDENMIDLLDKDTSPLYNNNSYSLLEDCTDTDFEDGDDDDYTKQRRHNKEIRYKSRNSMAVPVHERTENVKFIQDFSLFMDKSNVVSCSANVITSKKAARHLFHQDDSFLSYHTKENESFCLERLRNFTSDNLINLKYPLDWIVSTSGRDGNKGCDRLKAHAALRKFLEYEVDNYSSSLDFCGIKIRIKENLDSITSQVSKNKLFKKFTVLSNQKKSEKDKAEMILHPAKVVNIETVVQCWNESLEKMETEKDMQFIFENAERDQTISARNFTKYSAYARITLLLR